MVREPIVVYLCPQRALDVYPSATADALSSILPNPLDECVDEDGHLAVDVYEWLQRRLDVLLYDKEIIFMCGKLVLVYDMEETRLDVINLEKYLRLAKENKNPFKGQ